MPYRSLGEEQEEEEGDKTNSNYACCCAILCAMVIIFPTAFLFLSTLRSEKENPILWSFGLFVFLLVVFLGCALAGLREKVRQKRQFFQPHVSASSPDPRGLPHMQILMDPVPAHEPEASRILEEEERAHENGWRSAAAARAAAAATSTSRPFHSRNRGDDLELPKKYSEYERPSSLHLASQ